MRKRLIALAPLFVAACSHAAAPPLAEPPAPATSTPAAEAAPAQEQTLTEDLEVALTGGGSLRAPKGWHLLDAGKYVELRDPEREIVLRVAPASAGEPKALIEQAWRALEPSFARTPKELVAPPPRGGWDEAHVANYEINPSELVLYQGLLLGKGGARYTALIRGPLGAIDRRGAELMVALETLRGPGAEEESFAGKRPHPLDEARLAELSRFTDEARELSGIPGAALVVVDGGKVVLTRGFGVRERGKPAKVEPTTPFMIGSTTKELTSLLLAAAVTEGRARWEQPLAELLEGFALGDEAATQATELRHSVCACTGLPRQDLEFLFEYEKETAESRLALLRTMKPSTAFGATFQYSNLMVAAGGYAAGRAFDPKLPLAVAYERALKSRILDPIGMRSTTLVPAEAQRRGGASPHSIDLDLEVQPIPLSVEGGVVSVGPAGALWSTAEDLGKLLLVELSAGALPDGRQLVAKEHVARRAEPMVRIGDKAAYGLGMFIADERGVRVLGHAGNTLGFSSDFFFLPEHGVGVAIVANLSQGNAFRRAVRRKLLELMFDGAPEAEEGLRFSLERRKEDAARQRDKLRDVDASAFAPWLGRYESKELGRVDLRRSARGFEFDAGEWKASFQSERSEDGTESIVLIEPPLSGFPLRLVVEADKRSLVVDAGQKSYVFEKR